jgi:isoleucyl-tRNA synthetase
VLGHVCDREGKKESKSKGNYTPPEVILERVRMEFGAFDASLKVKDAKDGIAWIAREDFEGLDFAGENAKVVLYRSDREGAKVPMELKPLKGLARRIVALTKNDLDKLGLAPTDKTHETPPNDVPRLPVTERVTIEDPGSPAPGADAFRWFFYASSPSWTNTRHSLSNVRLEQKEFLVKLRNVYSFFTIYANIDGFDPARGNEGASNVDAASLAKSRGYRPAKERSLLDRWILSELALTVQKVTEALDAYHLYDAARAMVDHVEAVSNWYVRRSRSRFWAAGHFSDGTASTDKADAYFTLYEVLVTLARLSAPFVPFFAEELYQNLVKKPWPTTQPDSVHLVAFPTADASVVDPALAREMRAVRDVVSLGLQVRTANKLKVRQPLAVADLVLSDRGLGDAVMSHADLVADELNVHEVKLLAPGQEASLVAYTLKPNFRALGPKLGKKVQLAKDVLAKCDASKLRAELAEKGAVEIDLDGDRVSLTPDEIQVSVDAKEGFAAAGGRVGVVVLDCHITEALRDEGLGREVLARIQSLRKELALEFSDRVRLHVDGSERVRRIARDSRALFEKEALADALLVGDEGSLEGERREVAVDGESLTVTLRRA